MYGMYGTVRHVGHNVRCHPDGPYTAVHIRFASDPQIALQVAPHPCSPKENGLLSCAAGMLII